MKKAFFLFLVAAIICGCQKNIEPVPMAKDDQPDSIQRAVYTSLVNCQTVELTIETYYKNGAPFRTNDAILVTGEPCAGTQNNKQQ